MTFYSLFDLPERFQSKVTPEPMTGCWIYTANVDRDGYGIYSANRKNRKAHRYAYETLVGPIPEGLTIDHKCFNKQCVNPQHLEPVTSFVNLMRSPRILATKARTHCERGHLLSPDNIRHKIHAPHHRACLKCSNEKAYQRYWHKKRLEIEGAGGILYVQGRNRTHCKRGHLMDEANTFTAGNAIRGCRTCRAETRRRFDLKKANKVGHKDGLYTAA